MSNDGSVDPLADAILPDGSVDVSKLPAGERAQFKLARDILALRALEHDWPTDPDMLRQWYLQHAGLGPRTVEVVLAMIEHPEIVEDVLAFIKAKTGTNNEPASEQPADSEN